MKSRLILKQLDYSLSISRSMHDRNLQLIILSFIIFESYMFFSRYFPYIFNMSGARANVEKFGSWFSYEAAPRAQMFKRDHGKVVDMDSMMKLMRCKAVLSLVYFL